MNPRKEIAVIGVGNLLLGDEGVGIHAIEHLEKFDWPGDIELIDAGVPGASLLHIIENRKLSIIIDCADFGGKPGDILAIDVEKLKKPDEHIISLHNTSLLGTLDLAKKADIKTGKVILIAVQPKSIEITDCLSDEIASTLPAIRAEILSLLNNL